MGQHTGKAVEGAFADRRLARCRLKVSEGGIRGAAAHFADKATPGLLIVESDERSEDGLIA